jgi:hypothetical protein
MGVYELSGAGSIKTGRTLYTSMNAGNQYGAMVPIASYTADGTSNGFTFSNIPQTYQDLRLVMSYKSTDTSYGGLNLYPNTGTPTDRSITGLQGDGSSATSWRYANAIGWYNYNPNLSSSLITGTGIFISTTWDILNYANTTTFKTGLVRVAADSNGSGVTSLIVNSLRNTAAISILTIYTAYGNYTAGSTATLYGIRAVSS